MPVTPVTLSNGKEKRVVKVKHPEGATKEQIHAYALNSVRNGGKKGIDVPHVDQDAPPPEPSTYDKARPYVHAATEAGLTTLGGILAAPAAPMSVGVAPLVGAAGGYAASQQLNDLLDYYVGGYVLPDKTVAEHGADVAMDALTGAAYDAGGLVALRGAAAVAKPVLNALGRLNPSNLAAHITRFALTRDGVPVDDAVAALRASPGTVHSGQALSEFNAPTTQALIDRTIRRTPAPYNAMMESQKASSRNALAGIARGDTATAVRASADESKSIVNDALVPVLKREMAAADTARVVGGKLKKDVVGFRDAASSAVDDVGKFVRMGESAKQWSKYWRPSTHKTIDGGIIMTPLPLRKYTHPGELAELAETMANQSANASLDYGLARRHAQYGLDSIEAHGLRPLSVNEITGALRRAADDPKNAGNLDLERSVKQLIKEFNKWSDAEGVISADALEALRKNAVNSVSHRMSRGDPTLQKRLAGKMTAEIRPLIVEAFERAGGKDYGDYLTAYSRAMNEINQRKLSGKALELWKKSPDEFVRLVQGETPDVVEEIMGPGQYDIAKELGDSMMDVLRREADTVIRNQKVGGQVSDGQEALRLLLLDYVPKWRFPSYLSVAASTGNKALQIAEKKIGRKTLDVLGKSFMSGTSTADLLETLPVGDRNRVIQFLDDPSSWSSATRGAVAGSTAAVHEQEEPVNSLRRDKNTENVNAYRR